MTAGLIKQLHLLPRLGTFAVPAVCDSPRRDLWEHSRNRAGGRKLNRKRSKVSKRRPGSAWGSPPFLSSCPPAVLSRVTLSSVWQPRALHGNPPGVLSSLPSGAGVAAPFTGAHLALRFSSAGLGNLSTWLSRAGRSDLL